MHKFKVPPREKIVSHLSDAFSPTFNISSELIKKLDIIELQDRSIEIPLVLEAVVLPVWAQSVGVNGTLLVPREAVSEKSWDKVDWLFAAFLMLECWHERIFEDRYGSIHSYSYRLKGWDDRVWDHAWVNRIILLLVLWIQRIDDMYVNKVQNNKPWEIVLTHDVDAVEKTIVIRIKQSLFVVFNGLRQLLHGRIELAWQKLKKAIRFFFLRDQWWLFEETITTEKTNISQVFNFYVRQESRSLVSWLFDPSYNIKENKFKLLAQDLLNRKKILGLHPGFESFADSETLKELKNELDLNLDTNIKYVRQHWLRFSWFKTWKAQESAGLEVDLTLMFNDRLGFRNSAAIMHSPYNLESQQQHSIKIIPTILMDSHLFDYTDYTDDQTRNKAITDLLSEVKEVHGKAAVLWHPHTLSVSYGWGKSYEHLLDVI